MSSNGTFDVQQSGNKVTISGKVETWAQATEITENFTINGEKVALNIKVLNFTEESSSSAISSSSETSSSSSEISSSSESEISSSSEDSEAIASTGTAQKLSVAVVGRSLEIASASPVNVTVFDMQGRLMKQLRQVNGAISLQSLQTGSYIIRVQSASANWTKRIALR